MVLRQRPSRVDGVRSHDLCSQDLPIIASALARPGAGDLLVVRMLLLELLGVVTAFRFPWHSRVPSDVRRDGGVPYSHNRTMPFRLYWPDDPGVNTYETIPFRLFTSDDGCAKALKLLQLFSLSAARRRRDRKNVKVRYGQRSGEEKADDETAGGARRPSAAGVRRRGRWA